MKISLSSYERVNTCKTFMHNFICFNVVEPQRSQKANRREQGMQTFLSELRQLKLTGKIRRHDTIAPSKRRMSF